MSDHVFKPGDIVVAIFRSHSSSGRYEWACGQPMRLKTRVSSAWSAEYDPPLLSPLTGEEIKDTSVWDGEFELFDPEEKVELNPEDAFFGSE